MFLYPYTGQRARTGHGRGDAAWHAGHCNKLVCQYGIYEPGICLYGGLQKTAIEQDIPPFKKGYHWAEADVAQAAAYMKRLCEDSAFYEQKKAAAGAYIREKTKMQHSVSLLEDRLGKILEERK